MTMQYHEMDIHTPTLGGFITLSELIFSVIFCMECLIKIFGMGAKLYFSSVANTFDFTISIAFVIGMFLPSGKGIGALRGLRVIVKLLRVARSAKVLLKVDAISMLMKTIAESGVMVLLLGIFCIFMLLVLTVVAGHTLGRCHLNDDGTINPSPDLFRINFYTFSDAFYANFLIMFGQSWSGIMFDYADCAGDLYWVYFVVTYSVMNFFVGNLFVAAVVINFCITEEEKMVKQEKNRESYALCCRALAHVNYFEV
jgi:hypothetical protein